MDIKKNISKEEYKWSLWEKHGNNQADEVKIDMKPTMEINDI